MLILKNIVMTLFFRRQAIQRTMHYNAVCRVNSDQKCVETVSTQFMLVILEAANLRLTLSFINCNDWIVNGSVSDP